MGLIGLITRRSRVQIPPPLRRKPLEYLYSRGFSRAGSRRLGARWCPTGAQPPNPDPFRPRSSGQVRIPDELAAIAVGRFGRSASPRTKKFHRASLPLSSWPTQKGLRTHSQQRGDDRTSNSADRSRSSMNGSDRSVQGAWRLLGRSWSVAPVVSRAGVVAAELKHPGFDGDCDVPPMSWSQLARRLAVPSVSNRRTVACVDQWSLREM